MAMLVEICLKSALFVASGHYTIGEMEPASPGSIELLPEDYCRKHGLRATEESVS